MQCSAVLFLSFRLLYKLKLDSVRIQTKRPNLLYTVIALNGAFSFYKKNQYISRRNGKGKACACCAMNRMD